MELQEKLDGFRASFETDMHRKTVLDNEALRVKTAGMEQLALQDLYPEIRKIGAQLACITPEKKPLPAEHPLAQVATQMGVGSTGEGRAFPVLWDEGNRVADLFGLKHDFSDATRDLYRAAEVGGMPLLPLIARSLL